jgi:hypothetical protein
MRIIQGSVMPQVNGGIIEVAKVFLPLEGQENTELFNKDDALKYDPKLKPILQAQLLVFLDVSKQMLLKASKALFQDGKIMQARVDFVADDDMNARVLALKKRHQEHESNVIWMKEMEKGFALLLQTMSFYIGELPGFAALSSK